MLQKINSLRFRRGQSTLEYAILIVIVIGALIAVQFYIKRGLQGRFKSAADDIGDQFSPNNTNGLRTTTTYSKTRDTFNAGISNAVLTAPESTNTFMELNIIDADYEYYGENPVEGETKL